MITKSLTVTLMMGALGFGLLCTLPKLNRPMLDDEVETAYIVQALLARGTPDRIYGGKVDFQLPVYHYVVAGLCQIGGFNPASLRSLGIITLLLTALGLLLLAKAMVPEPLAPVCMLTSWGIYFTSPAILQGSLLAEIDTTIIPLLTILACLGIARVYRHPHSRWAWAFLGLALAMAWLVKPTTTFALLACVLALMIKIKGGRRGVWLTLGFTLVTFTVWGILVITLRRALNLEWGGTGHYLSSQFRTFNPLLKSAWTQMMCSFAEHGLWFSIFWMGLMATQGVRSASRCIRGRRFWTLDDILFVFVLIVGGFYIVGFGASFAFPRYVYPMLPVAAILIASVCAPDLRAINVKPVVGALIVAVWIGLLIGVATGDPLKLYSIDLRSCWIDESKSLARVGLLLALYLGGMAGLGAGLYRYYARRLAMPRGAAWRLMLTTGLLAANIQLSAQQALAAYATTYAYGASGTAQVIAYVRPRILAGQTILAPVGLTYACGGANFIPGKYFWQQPEIILDYLERQKTDFLIMGLRANTIEAMRQLQRSLPLQKYLSARYRWQRIGTYEVWERVPPMVP